MLIRNRICKFRQEAAAAKHVKDALPTDKASSKSFNLKRRPKTQQPLEHHDENH
jgi:hypothetical protein